GRPAIASSSSQAARDPTALPALRFIGRRSRPDLAGRPRAALPRAREDWNDVQAGREIELRRTALLRLAWANAVTASLQAVALWYATAVGTAMHSQDPARSLLSRRAHGLTASRDACVEPRDLRPCPAGTAAGAGGPLARQCTAARRKAFRAPP